MDVSVRHVPSCQIETCLATITSVFCSAFRRVDRVNVENLIQAEVQQGHHYLVAIADGQIHGFVSWAMRYEPRHQIAELVHIGTNPYGPRGLGRPLIAAMEADIRDFFQDRSLSGIRMIYILTHADNPPAHNLYERCGYKHAATIPSFFRAGMDEYMFTKHFE
ncbi:MAG: GNAT family N-acetyltransferase [Candidatus Kerfeldbacteria bacterium]|nr:GNAT family N-acetyltransferase [Candidatus Kerfeldbacteria bacterium]